MSLIRTLLARREERALTATEAIRRMIQSTVTRSGVAVSEQSALSLMAVFTAVRVLSESFAQVPLKVYRSNEDGSRDEVRDHRLYKILHDQPNTEMSSFTLREVMLGHLLLWGNAYCEIARNFNNDAIGLWPLLPNRTNPHRKSDGRLVYTTRIQKDPAAIQSLEEVELDARNVLHIKGFGFNGLIGLSVIGTIREGLGLAFAYEQFGSAFFGNGAVPGFVLSTDQILKKEYADDLERKLIEAHQGLNNAQRLMILSGGLKPEKIGIPPEDAQFIESRKFTRGEIMGFYRIPPHMTNDAGPSAWGAGLQQMDLAFVKYTMMPIFERFEQELNLKLFGAPAQGPIYPEFDPDGFLRGDFKSRMEGYGIGRQWGWLSVNDIKRKENESGIGAQGDIYLSPMNMQSAKFASEKPEPSTPIAPANGDTPATQATRDLISSAKGLESASAVEDHSIWRRAFAESQRHIFADVIERTMRREKADVVRGVEKVMRSGGNLEQWLTDFYSEHRTWFADQARPMVLSLADAVRADVTRETGRDVPASQITRFAHALVDGMAERIARQSEGVIRDALISKKEATKVGELLDRRSDRIAIHEARRATNAVATSCYKELGIEMQWVAGDSCPECVVLDGTAVRAGMPFVDGIKHPPLCAECGCFVTDSVAKRHIPERPAPRDQNLAIFAALVARQQAPQAPAVVNFNERAIVVEVPVTIEKDAISAPSAPPVTVNINKGAVQVAPPSLTIAEGAIRPSV